MTTQATIESLPAYRAAIKAVELTPVQRDEINESRELIKAAYQVGYDMRPHNPDDQQECALWTAYCEAGDRLRANPCVENATALIVARTAMENAPRNVSIIMESLRPTIESHQRRLADIASDIIDRAGELLKTDSEKRRAAIGKGAGMTITEELQDHDRRLAACLARLESEREAACRPDAAHAWLEENGF